MMAGVNPAPTLIIDSIDDIAPGTIFLATLTLPSRPIITRGSFLALYKIAGLVTALPLTTVRKALEDKDPQIATQRFKRCAAGYFPIAPASNPPYIPVTAVYHHGHTEFIDLLSLVTIGQSDIDKRTEGTRISATELRNVITAHEELVQVGKEQARPGMEEWLMKPLIGATLGEVSDPQSILDLQSLRLYRLEAEFDGDNVRHTRYSSDTGQIENEDWTVCEIVGHGRFSVVHKHLEKRTGQVRAVKNIDQRKYATLAPRYSLREPHIMAILAEHSSLFVQFLGWFKNSETLYLAMEYIELGDLRKHLGKPLSEGIVQEITKQLLAGLRVMHKAGMAHRDLKPENIFVVSLSPMHVKLGDVGISKQAGADSDTYFHTQVYTESYTAPEVLGFDLDSQSSYYTNAVDIWSLGCVLFELLTGRKLFKTSKNILAYCMGKYTFPAKVLMELPSPTGDSGILFINNLVAPSPKERPSAVMAVQAVWLMEDHIAPHAGQTHEKLRRPCSPGPQRANPHTNDPTDILKPDERPRTTPPTPRQAGSQLDSPLTPGEHVWPPEKGGKAKDRVSDGARDVMVAYTARQYATQSDYNAPAQALVEPPPDISCHSLTGKENEPGSDPNDNLDPVRYDSESEPLPPSHPRGSFPSHNEPVPITAQSPPTGQTSPTNLLRYHSSQSYTNSDGPDSKNLLVTESSPRPVPKQSLPIEQQISDHLHTLIPIEMSGLEILPRGLASTRFFNSLKGTVEDLFGPVDWRPLGPRIRAPKPDFVRVRWRCKCGYPFTGEVPKQMWAKYKGKGKLREEETDITDRLPDASKQWEKRTTFPGEISAKAPLAPSTHITTRFLATAHNAANESRDPTSPSASTPPSPRPGHIKKMWGSALERVKEYLRPQEPALPTFERPATQTSTADPSSAPGPSLHYIFLCVGTPWGRRTVFDNIEIPPNPTPSDDVGFFRNLKSKYRELGGKRRLLSFRTLSHFKFIRFVRYHHPNVICEDEEQLPPPNNPDYDYSSKSPRQSPPPIDPEEFMHYFEQPECVEELSPVTYIPKKITGPLPPKLRIEAWGLHAQRDVLCLYAFLAYVLFILVCTLLPVIFWLKDHPGDLQNAFAPGMYVLAFLTAVPIILEFLPGYELNRRKKKQE